MGGGILLTGGAKSKRFTDPEHVEYWHRVAIEDARRKADEWFKDPSGPREVKLIFVQAEHGYDRCRIHTLTPDNLRLHERETIELPGWWKKIQWWGQ